MTSLYVDLLVIDDDLAVDYAGEAILVNNRESIAQDMKHLIRESGLVVALIGERNAAQRAYLMQQLLRLIAADIRLIPGSIEVNEITIGEYRFIADTVKFGTVDFTVSI